MGTVLHHETRFRRYPADRFAGLNNDLAEPSAIPAWDKAADEIDRYYKARAAQRDAEDHAAWGRFMRARLAALRPGSGEI